MYGNFPGKGDLYWHVHHEILAEALTEPLQNRLDYIEQQKPVNERAWRAHLIRRVNDDENWPSTLRALRSTGSSASAEFRQTNGGLAVADLETLHAKQCFPNCPWNGKTIFPKPQF